jgi:hypothetical protein
MATKVTAAGVALLILLVAATALVAQDTKAMGKSGSTNNESTRTVTGCLRPGDGSNQFKFEAQDGGTWEVRSDNVKLGSQIGHTVTLTGLVASASANNKEGHSRMAVNKLVVISNGCQTDIPMQQ